MRELGVYEVVGSKTFRDHLPGSVFAAALDPRLEMRAIRRGSVRLIERMEMDLPQGKHRLPDGWLQSQEKEEK